MIKMYTVWGSECSEGILACIIDVIGKLQHTAEQPDLCLYYKWKSAFGLIAVLSGIDDIMICGNKEGVLQYKKLLTEKIDCDDVGPLTDYIGNKIDIDCENRSMHVTQPVLLRSFKDEFNVEVPENCPTTPAAPGSVLRGTSEENTVGYPEQRRYWSGVGKLLYLMKWSRPDVLNSVHDLSRFLSGARPAHLKAM